MKIAYKCIKLREGGSFTFQDIKELTKPFGDPYDIIMEAIGDRGYTVERQGDYLIIYRSFMYFIYSDIKEVI